MAIAIWQPWREGGWLEFQTSKEINIKAECEVLGGPILELIAFETY